MDRGASSSTFRLARVADAPCLCLPGADVLRARRVRPRRLGAAGASGRTAGARRGGVVAHRDGPRAAGGAQRMRRQRGAHPPITTTRNPVPPPPSSTQLHPDASANFVPNSVDGGGIWPVSVGFRQFWPTSGRFWPKLDERRSPPIAWSVWAGERASVARPYFAKEDSVECTCPCENSSPDAPKFLPRCELCGLR